MNNMLVRAISGAIYVAVIIAAILCGNISFFALMMIFAVLGMIELQTMFSHCVKIPAIARIIDILFVLAVVSVPVINNCCLYGTDYVIMSLLLYVPLRISIAVLNKTENQTGAFAYSIFSVIYLGIALACLGMAYKYSSAVVLATFVLIWLNDTGAYLSGVTMGKHKLCERLSPKKTWEGFFGGFIMCIIAGVVISYWLYGDSDNMTMPLILWCGYGAVVSIASTIGDLFESMIKRTVGVKDSGNLIPGHGGILDRIDSLLAVSVFAMIVAKLFRMLAGM